MYLCVFYGVSKTVKVMAIATMKVETRGETSEINDFMLEQALSVIRGAASMYQLEVDIDIVGFAKSGEPSPK